MSTTIDQKIVEMKFDNSDFEKNTRQSMSTLDKLKDKLHLKGASDGLDEVANAADRLNFQATTTGLRSVTKMFGTMFDVAYNSLNKLTDQATRFVKSMTLDQAMQGFQKYEETVAYTQTIMSATGKTIDEVSEKLAQLQWFSDETSYSFTDMTSNVGKFTSSGVELDEAVDAMQGIATWAAISGQNASTATRAMNNLAQAMGMGYVGLMDWKSIELANMATQSFKENAIQAGIAMGTLYEKAGKVYTVASDMEVTAKNFRETLSDKWFSADPKHNVISAVLGEYGRFATAIADIQDRMGIGTASQTMQHVDQFIKRNNIDGSTESMIALANAFHLTAGEAETLYDAYQSVGKEAFIAAQQAKTWTDVVEATKDAVSSTWMRAFQAMFGDYQDAKILFTDMANEFWNIFAGPVDVVASALEESMNHVGAWDTFISALEGDNLKKSADAFETAMLKVANGMEFKYGQIELLEDDLDKGLKKGDLVDAYYTLDELIAKFGSLERVTERGFITQDMYNAALKELGLEADKVTDEMDVLNELQQSSYSLAELWQTGGRIKIIEGLANIYHQIKKIFESIKTAFTNVFDTSLAERITIIIDTFYDFASSLKVTDELGARITETFEGIFRAFRLAVSIIGSVGTAIMGVVGRIMPVVIRTFGGVVETVSGYIGTLSEVFTEVFARIYDIVVDGIEQFKNSQFYSSVQGFIDTIKGYFQSIGDSITNAIGQVTADSVMEFLTTIATGISSLAHQVLNSELATNIIASLTALINDLSKAIKEFKMPTWTEFVEGLNNFFNGIWLKSLTSLDDVKQALLSFFDTKIKTKFRQFSEAIGTLFIKGKASFTEALDWLWNTAGMIAKVIGRFVKLSAGEIYTATKNILALGQMFAVFKLIMNTANLVKAVTNHFQGNDASGGLEGVLLAIANVLKTFGAVVAEMVALIYILGKIPTEQLEKGMGALGAIAGALAILVVLMGIFTSFGGFGDKQWSTALTILAFGYLLKQLCDVLIELGHYQVDNWGDAIFGIVTFVGTLVAVYFMLSKMSGLTLSSSLPILALATGMKMMLEVVQEYQKFKWNDNKKGIMAAAAVIAAMMRILGAIAKASGNDTKSAALTLVGFAIALKVIVNIIQDLGSLKMSVLIKGELALMGIVAFLLGVMKVLDKFGKASTPIDNAKLSTKIGTFIGIVFLLLAATAAIVILGKQPTDQLLKGTGAVTLILASIAAIFYGLGQLSNVGMGKIAGLVFGVVAVIAAMAFLYKFVLSTADYSHAGEALQVIAVMLGYVGAVAVAAVTLGTLVKDPTVIDNGLIILAKVAAFVAAIVGIVAIVTGAVSLIKGAEDFLLGAVRISGLLGQVIGSFIGGIAGGAAGAFVAGQAVWLPDIANNIKTFFENLKPILSLFSSEGTVDASGPTMEKMGTFAKAMSDLITALASMGTNANKLSWTETAAEKIKKFFTQLLLDGTFANALNEVDNVSVTNAGIIADIVHKLIPLAETGGIKSWWSGELDFGKLADNLEEFGTAMTNFAEDIKSTSAFDSSLSEKLKNFTEVASAIFDLYEIMPTDQSWLEKIFDGTKNWGSITEGLESFVGVLNTVVAQLRTNPLTKSDVDQITMFGQVVTELSNVYNNLPEEKTDGIVGSLWKGLFGGTNETSGWETMMASLESLVDRLKTFAQNMTDLKGSDAYINAKKNIDDMFTEIAGAVLNNTELWGEAGKAVMTYFVSGMYGKMLEAIGDQGMVTQSTTKLKETFDALNEDATKSGQSIVAGIIKGMEDKREDMYNSMANVVDGAVSSMRAGYGSNKGIGIYTKFYQVGQYAAEGLKAGMNSWYAERLVSNGGYRLGQLAYNAAKAAIESSSPSKKFMELGEYSAEGYNIGITNSLGSVASTMNRMGETSMNTLRDTVGRLASSIETNPDARPVIRPVLDMEDVDNGLSSMAKGNYNVGLFGTATTSGLTSSIKLQNGGNTVAGAIASLKDDLNSMKNEFLGMQLVMDSGALVGSISNKMDGALGTISTYKGRGNL